MPYSVTQTQFQSCRSVCHYGKLYDNDKIICSWVYDCGKKAFVRKISPVRDLDYIFVSHFDSDHVNGIANLPIGNNTKIYIPYIPASVFIIMLVRNNYTLSGLAFMRRVYVEMLNKWKEKEDSEFISQDKIFNSTPILTKGNVVVIEEIACIDKIDWEFFVASYVNSCILKRINFVWKRLKKNGLSFQKVIKQGLTSQQKNYLKKLKRIYHNICGSIATTDINNVISMCVYTGPTNTCQNSNLKNTGWLHTGDSCLHLPHVLNYFLTMFRNYQSRVAVLSLPHHGSSRTNTSIVISNLLTFFPQAQLVIPYSNAVKKCCHRNYLGFCSRYVFCTNYNDASLTNGIMSGTRQSLCCSNTLCKIY